MGWLGTFFIAVLTAALGALLSGIVASLAVDWYRISSFEGGSGYFVAFIALAGLVGGFLIGGITARVVAGGAQPGFGKGLGYALLIVLLLAGAVAGISRWLADVPPTRKGEQLMMLVEVRWPAAQQRSPASDAVVRVLELGALSGNSLRTSRQGPLWMEDARLEDGRWIVPGAVELFTNRGARVIGVSPEMDGAHGLLLPMEGTPAERHLSWSEWLPRARPGAAALADGFSYRFKVIARSQPSRTETVGAFQVDTLANHFYVGERRNGQPVMAASAQFAVRHQGRPVTFELGGDPAEDAGEPGVPAPGQPAAASTERVASVATLPGLPSALLVRVEPPGRVATCRLLVDEGSRVRVTRVARCDGPLTAEPLTNDQAWREAAKSIRTVQGQIDRQTFMHPGAYLFGDAILDAVQRSVRPVATAAGSPGFNASVAPLGISPDGRSIVRVGFSQVQDGAPALLVLPTDGAPHYLVEIDQKATRYAGDDGLDITWLAHYHAWQRGADGRDRLVPRPGVKPLPYRGVLQTESRGNLVYRVQPVAPAMVDVLAAFLGSEFKAQATPQDQTGYGLQTHIGSTKVHVSHNETDHYVAIFLDDDGDMELVRRIAQRFDAVLATGQHDRLFNP